MENPKESPHDRFKRLATSRTNAVLKKLDVLGNCSNKQVYKYTDADIEKIFAAILKKARDTRERFQNRKEDEFSL